MIFICLCADYLTIYMKVFVGILVFLILIKVEFIGSNSVENEIQFINNGQSLWMVRGGFEFEFYKILEIFQILQNYYSLSVKIQCLV